MEKYYLSRLSIKVKLRKHEGRHIMLAKLGIDKFSCFENFTIDNISPIPLLVVRIIQVSR